jgi:hypothetical protein
LEIKNLSPEENHICKYDDLAIYYINKNKKFKLYDNQILCDLEVFKKMLEKALENKLLLDPAIKDFVGLIWNEKLHEEEGTHQKFFDVEDYYSLWSSGAGIKYSTWIYNKDNTTMLEISPDYPWHFLDPKPNETYITYDEWKKSYESILIGPIDKKTIKEWINQLNELFFEMEQDLEEANLN